ncbi:hypothetical protein EI94DRAFT_1705494 [Lactarius quietus]|nr:hypothetical protein EI94DRAFT_1705494 [Lactarius quietus]
MHCRVYDLPSPLSSAIDGPSLLYRVAESFRFLRTNEQHDLLTTWTIRTTRKKMVNWNDPALLVRDYFDLTKLIHAVGGLYIWETVFFRRLRTECLARQQPYRWTIWIYLATRYSCLLMFIIFFIHNDAGNVPCKPLILMNYNFQNGDLGSQYSRVFNRIFCVVYCFGLSIRSIWPKIGAVYNPEFDVCLIVNSHSGMVSVVAIPVADTILLSMMFVGLLATRTRISSQCIIWMIVAAIAEIPPMVFLILNLNAAWNEMFPQVAGPSAHLACTVLCASKALSPNTRTHSRIQSLSTALFLTFFFQFSPDPPYPPGLPLPNSYRRDAHGVPSTLHFRSTGTLEDHHDMTIEPFVFVPTAEEMIQVDLNDHDAVSNTTLAVPPKAKSRNVPAGYRLSWHRPVDASMPVLEFE